MPLTEIRPDGVHFQVWAPQRKSVSVQLGSASHPLSPGPDGTFAATIAEAKPGDRYRFLLDGHLARPDPCSRFQPEGVHGPSQIIDPSGFAWSHGDWRGVPRSSLIVYELHVGTFTAAGTYEAALERLDHILDLGATAVELLPLAQTPGRWNWGYDGVGLYAPNHRYGSPGDLRRFVDACHGRGLAVIVDVVYNHLGPEGNYWADFGPYFSSRHRTPWGPALNFDGAARQPVRQWIIQNALYWLREFRLDGLRLDAIHLMQDESRPHIVTELALAVREFAAGLPYPVHLIAESNVHDQALLDPPPAGSGYGLLWNDEIPHALFSAALGQHHMQSRTYQGTPDLIQALDTGFVFQWSADGRCIQRSAPGPRAELGSMLQGLQTHDQIGNHPLGYRLHQVASPQFQQAAAALILLHPAIPLCFMGEEFAAPSPFCFFVDFSDARMRRAVVEGRKRDYAHQDWRSFVSPLDEESFLRSKLPPPGQGHPGMLAWYRALIAQRKDWLSAGALHSGGLQAGHDAATGVFTLRYGACRGVFVNLGPQSAPLPPAGQLLLHSRWPEFGGTLPRDQTASLPPFSAAVVGPAQPG